MASHGSSSSDKKIVVYYGNWATYREGKGKFVVEDIDPNLCTHLVYAFAGLDEKHYHIKPLDPYNDLEENGGNGAYKRFNSLKKKHPTLKTLIAFGGWTDSSSKYSEMSAKDSNRRKFATSCVDFILKYGFNGLDLDWEYPAEADRGGRPEDKKNYILLLKELRTQFNEHGLLLTAAVSAGKSVIDNGYDVQNMVKYLDYISVMAYDYHDSSSSETGNNAPLNQKGDSVSDSINYWISLGAPPSKLVLGMGSYGRSFTLRDPRNHDLKAPTAGPGKAGPYTKMEGTLGYNEICENLKKSWTEDWDEKAGVPYAYKDNQWVGYDNPKSIGMKCDFGNAKALGGVMMWSVETEDFHGIYNGKKFPLLQIMNQKMKNRR